MKKIWTILAGALAIAATSCVKESQAVFDVSKATAPVLNSYSEDEDVITATYTPAVFKQGFNEKIAPNHSFALVSLDGKAMSKTLMTSDKDGVLSIKKVNLAKSLIALGAAEGSTVSLELAVRASVQDPSKDNGRNGYVDSDGRISITSFEVVIPEVTGSPYADFTEPSNWSVIGALSAYEIDWNGDLNMWTDGGGNHVAAHVKLAAGDEFKFRQDQDWAVNMGGDFGGLDNEFAVAQDGANIKVGADGVYDLYVNPDQGIAWITAAYDPFPDYTEASAWSVIGALSLEGIDWNGDIAMITDGTWHVALGVNLAEADEFKFRKDADWAVNMGGDFGGLDNEFAVAQDGANIKVGAAGSYDLYVNPDQGLAKVTEASGAKVSSKIGGDEPGPEPQPVTGWNIIGLNGDWENDILATQDGNVWTAYITAEGDTDFKWRKDAGWDENYGGTFVALGEPFEAVAGGDNIKVGAGFWKVVLNLDDMTITISNGQVWSLIGDFNEWAGDVDMVEKDGLWVAEDVDLIPGWKIRKNHDWAENRGGAFAAFGEPFAVTNNGDNIDCGTGKFTVTYNPAEETITVTPATYGWSLIGVNGDWNTDIDMLEVAPGIWVSPEVDITAEGWKLRYDHGWDVNRGTNELTAEGQFVKGVQNGDNIALTGKFKVVYNANSGTVGTLVWGVVGSIAGIPGFSWNNDIPMNLASDGKWYSVPVTLAEGDQIKIRKYAGWDENFGGTFAEADTPFEAVAGGDNIKAEGTYQVIYDPEAGTITLSKLYWGIVGEFSGWGGQPDVFMLPLGDGKWAAYGQTITGPWKVRQGSGWDVNRGGTFVERGVAFEAVAGGDNITIADENAFDVIYDATAETITVL